jgi:hypothetical protein
VSAKVAHFPGIRRFEPGKQAGAIGQLNLFTAIAVSQAMNLLSGRGSYLLHFLTIPMTTSRLSLLAIFSILASALTGCAAIGDIFKGGIWVGAIAVFLVVAIVWWLVSKMSGGSGGGGTSV